MSKRVCIFCGARTGNSETIIEETKKLIKLLADNDFNLVYGGGNSGLMGLAADEFLKHGKEVIGVRPDILLSEEITHHGIQEMIVTKDMFERKQKMVELSDIFIALPGGVGTLDEIIEVFTLNKIKSIQKSYALFNIDGFYDNLSSFLDQMVDYEFLDQTALDEMIVESEAEKLISRIIA